MENEKKSTEMSFLLNILSEGEEQMRQLSLHLNEQLQPASMHVQNSFSQAIAIVKSMEAAGMRPMPSHSHMAAPGSPGGSGSGSPRSEGSERTSKKRKETVKRTYKVQGTPLTGDTASIPDDGYSWRKYGQKNILNAKHPRSYYRCTHQKNQHCPALKHVQRSDEDPAIFNVTYQGEHICTQRAAGQASLTQSLEQQLLLIPTRNEPDDQVMINFNIPDLTIDTRESGQDEQAGIISPSFSITSAQVSLGPENSAVFSPPCTSVGGPFSSGFMSSATSDSNYLSVFQSQYGGEFGGASSFHGSESEFNEVIPVIPAPRSGSSAASDFAIEPPFPFDLPDPFK